MHWDRFRDLATAVLVAAGLVALQAYANVYNKKRAKERKARYQRYGRLKYEAVNPDLLTVRTAEGVIVSVSRGEKCLWHVSAFRFNVYAKSKHGFPTADMAKEHAHTTIENVLFPPPSKKKKSKG